MACALGLLLHARSLGSLSGNRIGARETTQQHLWILAEEASLTGWFAPAVRFLFARRNKSAAAPDGATAGKLTSTSPLYNTASNALGKKSETSNQSHLPNSIILLLFRIQL